MKFKIEANYLIKTEKDIELDPKKFLYCATIEELISEVEQYMYDNTTLDFFLSKDNSTLVYTELLGLRYWDRWFEEDDGKAFYLEWQRLKGLPAEF